MVVDMTVFVESQKDILDSAEEDLDKELVKTPLDDIGIEHAWKYYCLQFTAYQEGAVKLINQLIKDKKNDDMRQINRDIAQCVSTKVKLELMLKRIKPDLLPTSSSPAPATTTTTPPADKGYKLKLPKRDLPKFTGDVRDYLAFWAEFSDIDGDKSLSDIDKFHFLLQSTKEDSPARKLLQSYPFSAGNYKPALQSLKDRFGRNNVLVKVYVRDLLQLVINASAGKSVDFGDLVTTITSQIRNLETLGVTEDKCAEVLYPVVECCLPQDVLQAWQRHACFKEELAELMTFLQTEVNNYTERTLAHFQFANSGGNDNSSGGGSRPSQKRNKGDVPTTSSFVNSSSSGGGGSSSGKNGNSNCDFCERAHPTPDCQKALGMSLQEKRGILQKRRRCFKCLRGSNHIASACKFNAKCSICSRNHLSVMCPNLDTAMEINSSPSVKPVSENKQADSVQNPQPTAAADVTTSTTVSNLVESPNVPLQTLKVNVLGVNGKRKSVRAVLDPGSMKSYILSSLAEELECQKLGEEKVRHQLFGAKKTEIQQHNIVKVFVADVNGRNCCDFNCSTQDAIAQDLMTPPVGPWMKDFEREGITFTDTGSVCSAPVELLVGNDIVANLYTGRIYSTGYGPAAMETRWGWVMCGKYPNRTDQISSLLNVEGHSLAELWELEAIGLQDPAGKEDKEEIAKQTQQHFEKTVVQLKDGRYQICLPWITGMKEKLPSNYYAAARRLRSTTKDLQTKGFLTTYDLLFKLWEQDGMIEEVPPSEIANVGHYLPHRAVVKLSSATTPVRPVFDGSSKAKGRPSLNECLDKGPNMLELIPPILIRFRLRRIGVTADIKKAFQQISVSPCDRDYLRFVWWNNLELKKEKIYRHTRVVFGVTSSPYFLAATLQHHLKKTSGVDAEVARRLLSSTYVDNAILSVDSMKEALEFERSATSLLMPAKFDLRGWEYGPCEDDKTLSILGLLWNMKSDCLMLDVSGSLEKIDKEPSLRHVLSLVHSIFDPLGFVCPFTIVGKLLLRRCHELKLEMDTPLPDDLKLEVKRWAAQIPTLSEVNVPRYVNYGEDAKHSFHVLCDSSSNATAAAVFLRVEQNGTTQVFLLAAKSRVAPKKKVTIPRLELVACLIASRLFATVYEAMGKPDMPVTFWSDSSTALAWIRGIGPWGIFVSNCVEKIRQLTSLSWWRHVPGKDNIADLPSRGCSARKLIESRWWEGPQWLKLEPSAWPTTEYLPDENAVDTERRKTVTVAMVTTAEHPINRFLRYSEYPTILRALGNYLRLKDILKKKIRTRANNDDVEIGSSADYIRKAEFVIVYFIQEELRQNPERLKKLKYFVDEAGLLRHDSRLTHEDNEDFLCPIILPDKNEFVKRIIWWEHKCNQHAGVSTLLGILRNTFWLINGRRTVRSVYTRCWPCCHSNARRATAPEAPLPIVRSQMGVPFAVTGLDAAGPLFLKGGEKVWIILFTCATYRAVHLELVDTLTADGFIRALRRFVSRRGRPNIIYSDNARGFVAAKKAFSNLDWKKVEEYAAVARIEWRFNPPSAPWWGGWWERLIGSMKRLVRRVLGKKVVHKGELETLLCEVEDAMNSRPLTYSSENPDDPVPLTPNHFIRHCGALFLPEADLRDPSATRSAYKRLQHLREALRSRFRLEYLGFLRGNHYQKRAAELKPGDVVIVERDNFKRLDWHLGVILEAIPGRDGIKRLFRVKTKSGEILRPAQRLFPLEQEA